MIDEKKRRPRCPKLNIIVDVETEEVIDFTWNEDYEQPPLIIPKKPPESDSAGKKPRKS